MTVERPDAEPGPSGGQPYEYVIVGGGIHGTCLANFLLSAGGYAHEEIRIVEPREELLESFERKARQCGMQTLRSTFVQHISTDPFSLESFAEGAGREAELVSTDDYPNRPTLDLFVDHARSVVDRWNLDDCHRRSRVTGITAGDETLRVETNETDLQANRVVLALGLGARPTRPEWAQSLSNDAPIAHVWDESFELETAAAFDGETYVVGGGITAGQVACDLSNRTSVTLLTRHEFDIELSEADPHWLNWDHIRREIHTLPPGSRARHERIRSARNDATIPPYVERRLTDARACEDLDVRRGEIACAYQADDELLIRLADGTVATDAQVVLATGLDPVPEHPLVERVAESLSLERGAKRFPVLDDRTLAWRRTDGTRSSVYVSGALAEPSVGPFARNVIGARRVAERLLAPPDRSGTEGSRSVPKGRS